MSKQKDRPEFYPDLDENDQKTILPKMPSILGKGIRRSKMNSPDREKIQKDLVSTIEEHLLNLEEGTKCDTIAQEIVYDIIEDKLLALIPDIEEPTPAEVLDRVSDLLFIGRKYTELIVSEQLRLDQAINFIRKEARKQERERIFEIIFMEHLPCERDCEFCIDNICEADGICSWHKLWQALKEEK